MNLGDMIQESFDRRCIRKAKQYLELKEGPKSKAFYFRRGLYFSLGFAGVMLLHILINETLLSARTGILLLISLPLGYLIGWGNARATIYFMSRDPEIQRGLELLER